MKRLTRPVLVLISLALAAGLFFWLTPARHNPFTPADLAEMPGWGTWNKLTRLKRDPELCFAALQAVDAGFLRLADQTIGERCTLRNALLLERSLTPYSAELHMTCAETAALYTWERHVARPLAENILRSPIIRIETYGSFDCRNIAGTERLSEHGHGNAIDISGFRLADGRLVDVKQHWSSDGPEGAFLRAAHYGACDLFSVVLGPEYNEAHKDHFHFDMGKGGTCR